LPSLSDVLGFLRFGFGLKAFFRDTISVEAAKAIIQQGMQRRDILFLQKIEQAASPRAETSAVSARTAPRRTTSISRSTHTP